MTRPVGALAIAFVGGLVLMLVLGGIGFPGLGDLFRTETKDRSGAVVLRSIRDLTDYHPATANMQVLVDLEDDMRYVPAILKGQRGWYYAEGKVDAVIDFSRLQAGAVEVSEDRKSVAITLPKPTLGDAQVDISESKIVHRDRGVIDRLASVFQDSPTSDREFMLKAEEKMKAAAKADGGVFEAAERNTRSMLSGLIRGLGFTDVSVEFVKPATSTKS